MGQAVDVHGHLTAENGKLMMEIDRLHSIIQSKDLEKRQIIRSMDEQLISMERTKDIELSFLKDDDADKGENRALMEKLSRLETDNAALNGELLAIDKDTELKIEERMAAVNASIKKFEKEIEEKIAELAAVKAESDSLKRKVAELEANETVQTEQLSGIKALKSANGLMFDVTTQAPVACPIFLVSGAVISMKSLIEMWVQAPSVFDGEVHRMVKCPRTGVETFVAPKEQVDFISDLSNGIGVSTSLPLSFEYTKPPGGEWTAFSLYDQVALSSKVCKIYRRKMIEPRDFVMVNATMKVVFLLSDARNKLSFHVQSLVGDAVAIMQGRVKISSEWNPFPEMELV
jgi:hypothetical protein